MVLTCDTAQLNGTLHVAWLGVLDGASLILRVVVHAAAFLKVRLHEGQVADSAVRARHSINRHCRHVVLVEGS